MGRVRGGWLRGGDKGWRVRGDEAGVEGTDGVGGLWTGLDAGDEVGLCGAGGGGETGRGEDKPEVGNLEGLERGVHV